MIETMFKTHIVGIKSDAIEFSSYLLSLKGFHIKETTLEEAGFSLQFKEIKTDLEGIETRIATILSFISSEAPLHPELKDRVPVKKIIGRSKEILITLEPEVRQIESEKRQLEMKIRQLKRYTPILDRVDPLINKMTEVGTLESMIVILDRRIELTVSQLETEISDRTQGVYEIFHKPVDEHFDAVLFLIDHRYLKETQAYLTGERISEISFPPELRNVKLRDMKLTVDEMIKKHQESLTFLAQEQKKISSLEEVQELHHLQLTIMGRLAEFQLFERMGGTADTFEIEGFVPKSKIKTFKSSLKEKFGNRIIITSEKATARDEAPVLRRNRRIVRPFETITDMIQLPKYGTMDPTPFIFFLFPFFWGFMVGDVGYAGTIFLFSFLLGRRFKRNNQQALQNITEIIMISCVWAMVFGVVYFEVFGDLAEQFVFGHEDWALGIAHEDFPLPLINRYEAVVPLLLITILIGYVLIMGGMFLSVLNNFRLRHMSHVYSNLFLIGIWGSVVILIPIALIMPDLLGMIVIVDIGAIIVAIGFLLKLEGIAGLIHVIEKFSNILSFARLMAIGLVGAWMGLIANDLILNPSSLGFFSILLGFALHGINLMILVLSPSIHAMRLNVYEFFSQFVLSGGNSFHPFGSEN